MTLYQRYNWKIDMKYYRSEIKLFLAALFVIVQLWVWYEYLVEHDLRLTLENELGSVLLNHYALTTYGSWTPTDIAEGTIVLDVRSVK